MPNYDFGECTKDSTHRFEKFIPLSEWKDKMRIPCEVEGCKGEARQVVLPQGRGSTITPFVYFLNKNGEVRIAPSSNLPTPKGHTRCEVTTLHELRQLEKRVSREERSKIAYHKEIEDAQDAEMRAADRNDIKHYLSTNRVPEIDYEASDKTGEVVYTGRMRELSPQARDMMKVAMERNNQRRRFESHDPGMHFYILHNDDRKREYEG